MLLISDLGNSLFNRLCRKNKCATHIGYCAAEMPFSFLHWQVTSTKIHSVASSLIVRNMWALGLVCVWDQWIGLCLTWVPGGRKHFEFRPSSFD